MTQLSRPETIVLALLEQAAGGGRPCPKNEALAAAIGAKSISSAARVVALLETRGLIAVERGRRSRVVTILASGARTAETTIILTAPKGPRRADELAELVAEGSTLRAAARTMRLSQQRVFQIWAWIRSQLGPQAC